MIALVGISGSAVGVGLFAILLGLLPTTGDATVSWQRATRVSDRLGADAALVGVEPANLVVARASYALMGLMFSLAVATVMGAVGVTFPVVISMVLGVILAFAMWFVPEVDVRRRARAERRECRVQVAVLCELIALERLSDAGTGEAVNRSVAVLDTAFAQEARRRITIAQLAGRPAAEGLRELADRTGVPDAADVADILSLSGTQGAAIVATLRAKAESVRGAIRAELSSAANEASEHMVMPVALLGIAFLALLAYPAFARILG